MNKIIMTALVLVASASLFTAGAANKKKKNKGKKVAPIELKTSADSLSYAAGINATRGLLNYVQQSYQVDTAYMENLRSSMHSSSAKLPSAA